MIVVAIFVTAILTTKGESVQCKKRAVILLTLRCHGGKGVDDEDILVAVGEVPWHCNDSSEEACKDIGWTLKSGEMNCKR